MGKNITRPNQTHIIFYCRPVSNSLELALSLCVLFARCPRFWSRREHGGGAGEYNSGGASREKSLEGRCRSLYDESCPSEGRDECSKLLNMRKNDNEAFAIKPPRFFERRMRRGPYSSSSYSRASSGEDEREAEHRGHFER